MIDKQLLHYLIMDCFARPIEFKPLFEEWVRDGAKIYEKQHPFDKQILEEMIPDGRTLDFYLGCWQAQDLHSNYDSDNSSVNVFCRISYIIANNGMMPEFIELQNDHIQRMIELWDAEIARVTASLDPIQMDALEKASKFVNERPSARTDKALSQNFLEMGKSFGIDLETPGRFFDDLDTTDRRRE